MALWILSGTTRVSRYQKKHSPTHTYPPSITIHVILPVQFMCPTVSFLNFFPSFLWSASWPGTLNFKLHTFPNPIIGFSSQHMPIPSQPVLKTEVRIKWCTSQQPLQCSVLGTSFLQCLGRLSLPPSAGR